MSIDSRVESRESSEPPPANSSEEGKPQNIEDASIITDLPVMHTAKRLKIEARKLDGMQRELYSLMGDNAPPIVVAPSSKFKTKPEWQQRAAAWKLSEFEPKEGLVFKHWVRAASLADGTGSGDRFARFNTAVSVPEWSDADYSNFSSESWSLEETKYLFELARDFDLRWLVIADRYDFPSTSRSVDDLKERYYSVCSALIKNRPMSAELGLSPHDEEMLKTLNFDKESEEKRKAHLERLLSRSPKEVAEEEALILEARRLESMSTQLFNERRQLLRWLESPAPLNAKTTKADLNTSQGIGQLLQELQSEKSRKSATPSAAAAATGTTTTGNVSPATGGAAAARKTVANIVLRVLNRKLSQREETALGISYSDPSSTAKHPGVYLRSAKLTPIRQNLLAKVRAITAELGLPIKPVMPTARVCAQYESLYQSISILLEAKKIQDKLEMEIDVLKRTREAANSNETSSAVAAENDKSATDSTTTSENPETN